MAYRSFRSENCSARGVRKVTTGITGLAKKPNCMPAPRTTQICIPLPCHKGQQVWQSQAAFFSRGHFCFSYPLILLCLSFSSSIHSECFAGGLSCLNSSFNQQECAYAVLCSRLLFLVSLSPAWPTRCGQKALFAQQGGAPSRSSNGSAMRHPQRNSGNRPLICAIRPMSGEVHGESPV